MSVSLLQAINIDKVLPIRENNVNKHNTKDIDFDSINTSGGPSRDKPKHTKGGDTDREVEEAPSGNAVQRTIDTQCQANDGDGCYLESTDHRKIVSQYFGRNKRCTQLLTDDLWLVWCRKHYQQRRYNLQQEGIWHLKKLDLIKTQIERFKKSDRIAGWDIALHKTEKIRIDRENAAAVLPGAEAPVWERFLEPYLGFNKSYAELDVVLRVIEAEFQTTTFAARENKDKEMPAIEFLPLFLKGTANKPVTRPKNKTLTPHVKAKGKPLKPLTSKNSSQTMTPEATDKTATLTITRTFDTVPVLPSSPCKRKASSVIPRDGDSKMHVGYFPKKRRRLMRGVRLHTVHTKTEETE